MKRILVLMAATSLLALGCGGGGGPQPAETPSTQSDASATVGPTRARGAEIGQVDNADGDAFVNQSRANENLKLRAGDLIETGSDSSIDFTLSTPRIECKTLSRSQLQLRPDAKTQIVWKSRTGVSYCNVDRGQSPVEASFGIDPNIEIGVEGTLFGVVDDGTLRVVEGFVVLRAGATTQRVGPHEQVALSSIGQPGGREAWQGLPDDDQEMVSDLQTRRVPPSPLPTDSEVRQSKRLSAMKSRDAILVLLDSSASEDDEDFIWSYFELLAETWFQTEDVDVQLVTRQEAEKLLREQPNAVYVAPPSAPPVAAPTTTRTAATGTATQTAASATATPAPATSLGGPVFYVDSGGRSWSILFPPDQPAAAAFVRFTRAVLTTGQYFGMYFPLFDAAPPYDQLLRLIP